MILFNKLPININSGGAMSDKRKKPKSYRIQILLDMLERHGRSNKNEICFRVAQALDEDSESESFQRAIYRDLEDLVLNAQIAVEYFTRDGALIEEYDSDVHRNVSCQWFIPGAEGQITGGKQLLDLNGFLYVPKILINEFSLLSGNYSPDSKHRHIYFQIGHKFLCLKTGFDAIEYGIALSRIHGNVNTNEIKEVMDTLGKRSVILKLPIAKLSAFKPSQKICNAHIRVLTDGEIEIEEFGSTNPIYAYKLTMSEADEMRSKGDQINEETVTSAWVATSNFKATPEEVKGKLKVKCPLLIEFGETFHLLII